MVHPVAVTDVADKEMPRLATPNVAVTTGGCVNRPAGKVTDADAGAPENERVTVPAAIENGNAAPEDDPPPVDETTSATPDPTSTRTDSHLTGRD
jgi:hypothetical protein